MANVVFYVGTSKPGSTAQRSDGVLSFNRYGGIWLGNGATTDMVACTFEIVTSVPDSVTQSVEVGKLFLMEE